ncbi:MAG: M3 family metallopeptidase [Gammaproteobacteria bacterium]|nr:M3 family metallopeptidase [Gammaproteobacteria bacterium]
MNNPLLTPASPGELPAFDRIRPEHAEPAVDAILADSRRHLDELLADLASQPPSWESLIEPLDDGAERLTRAFGPVAHLFSVLASRDWRAAYNACLPKVAEYGIELSLSQALYEAYRRLAAAPQFAGLSPAQRKTVNDALRDFRLAGVALPAAQKIRFKKISLRLSELSTRFEENLLDATQAWHKHLPDARPLTGMTAQGLARAAEKARAKGLGGYWLTLDFPSYDAVIAHADDRALRHEICQAYASRASERGPQGGSFDNTPLMDEILALRREQTAMLGFANYAELALQTRMADSPAAVERFLLDLARRARPRALAELDRIKALARARDGIDDFAAWDAPYYAEKLRRQKLGLSDELLRPYFPAPQVIDGLLRLAERLFEVRIERVDGVPVWHPDVTTYRLRDAGGGDGAPPLGMFYLDAYARDNKRGGAWMDECLGRRRSRAGLQRPSAYLTCNFAPPLPGQPALLSHDEVLTLFHEFGHGLQHLLTRIDEPAVAGLHGIAWDAVELPSQFMENWAYRPEVLKSFARHWQTGEPIPDALVEKLVEDRRFGAGLATLRQVEMALFDLRLHTTENPDVYAVLGQVRSEVSVFPPPAWNRFPCSFSHVFAGGYAAGYYSYKWAEVLSADAYAAFDENGDHAATGRRFRDTVLGEGGAREAIDVFRDFRGREPSVEALLRQEGLTDATV